MLEAQDKTRTSKATSDMLRHKWQHPIQQPGPTQSLIQVCYVTPSARNALLGYYTQTLKIKRGLCLRPRIFRSE